jgi:signal transduction histidine kinase/Tfp pilus assembly protein PilF
MRLLLLLLIVPLTGYAHNQRIDSLKQVIETTTVDTVRGRTLCRLCMELRKVGDTAGSRLAGEQGLALARRAKDSKGEGDCLNTLGRLELSLGKYVQGLKLLKQALAIRKATGTPADVAASLQNIGVVYFNQGDFSRALETFQQSFQLYEELGDQEGMANVLINLGNIYWNQEEFSEASNLFHRSLGIYERRNNRAGMAKVLINLGSLHARQKEYDQALAYLERSRTLLEGQGDRSDLAIALLNLGSIHFDRKDYPQALHHYRQSLRIHRELSKRDAVPIHLVSIGSAHLYMGRPDSARWYALKGLELAGQMGQLATKREAARFLFAADSALGNWKEAFRASRLYHLYSDSLKNDDQSKTLGRIEAQAEYERLAQQERLNQAAQSARVRERFVWLLGSALGGLLLLALIAYILYRGRQKLKQAYDELRDLNEQISQQKSEIEAQNSEIMAQRDQLDETCKRLLAVDRMKEQLTGMIVHDLKNPLNAILGMSSLPPDPKRLQIIRSAGQQMSQLILNLLDVQRYENAALELHPEPVSAAQLVARAIDQTEFLAQQRQLTLLPLVDPRLHVRCDVELLVRVLVNLLTNAIKYAPAGDCIEIEAKLDPRRGAFFRVTDHGKGIPPDQLERIFDRFVQADEAVPSGMLRGTGLGLTFCRLTVEAHGGQISAASEPDRYTSFTFGLPQAWLDDQLATEVSLANPNEVHPLDSGLKQTFAPLIDQLRTVPLYNVSGLLDLLEQLPDEPSELVAWKAALEGAALAGNEARYRELLG